jgi:hypothetical protein
MRVDQFPRGALVPPQVPKPGPEMLYWAKVQVWSMYSLAIQMRHARARIAVDALRLHRLAGFEFSELEVAETERLLAEFPLAEKEIRALQAD